MRSLTELLKDHQMFHSTFQQDNLITKRAGGTLYGQYKQSLRELYKRTRGLREDWYQLEKSKNKIKQFEAKKKKLEYEINQIKNNPDIDERLKEIEIEEIQSKLDKVELDIKHYNMMLEEQERSKRETFRELKRFYAQADYLKTQIENKYGELTDELKDKLDVDMWIYRLHEMIAIDMVYNGRLLNTTYEFLNALPKEIKIDIFKKFNEKGPQYFIEWYENKTEEITPQIPKELPMPTEKDLLQLLDNSTYLIEEEIK